MHLLSDSPDVKENLPKNMDHQGTKKHGSPRQLCFQLIIKTGTPSATVAYKEKLQFTYKEERQSQGKLLPTSSLCPSKKF